jgi:biopolymer transport protein TolR
MSDIQLTSMMDLSFLLLITFLITFPLIEQGIPVDLPQGKAQKLPPEQSRTVTVDKAGNVYLDEKAISLDALAERMRGLVQGGSSVTVMVRADQSVQYREVVKVMKTLHDAGITKLALVTRGEDRA